MGKKKNDRTKPGALRVWHIPQGGAAMTPSALIPASDGSRLRAWTCAEGNRCGWCYVHTDYHTRGKGTAEEAAVAHFERVGHSEPTRIHVLESGRSRTFKVWRSARGVESREVMR